jgi:hypothetical protein
MKGAKGCAHLFGVTGRRLFEEDRVNTNTKPAAVTQRGTFRVAYAIRCTIEAPPERVWTLLTDGPGFARWNSTVSRLDGTIAAGEKLALEVPTAPGRVFRPKVRAFEPSRRMVWSDGMAPMFKGVRTFSLTPLGSGSTEFQMNEELSGLLLPMIKASLPDFGPVFETYAADLKRAAEAAV